MRYLNAIAYRWCMLFVWRISALNSMVINHELPLATYILAATGKKNNVIFGEVDLLGHCHID